MKFELHRHPFFKTKNNYNKPPLPEGREAGKPGNRKMKRSGSSESPRAEKPANREIREPGNQEKRVNRKTCKPILRNQHRQPKKPCFFNTSIKTSEKNSLFFFVYRTSVKTCASVSLLFSFTNCRFTSSASFSRYKSSIASAV